MLSIILSLYVFALAAMPCADFESDSLAHENITHTTNGTDNHSHDKNKDLCSPFCICNCCGQLTLTYVPAITFEFQRQIEEIITSQPTYTSILNSDFYGSIWQPPQLV